MCSLFINDLDAGAGRMGEATQYTVNNQMVGLPAPDPCACACSLSLCLAGCFAGRRC